MIHLRAISGGMLSVWLLYLGCKALDIHVGLWVPFTTYELVWAFLWLDGKSRGVR